MRLTFGEFWPLALLIVVPFIWRIQSRTLNDLSRKQLYALGALRSNVVLLLVVALMRPAIHNSAVRFSVAYLIDVSQSVSPASVDSAMQWMGRATNSKFSVRTHFIPFAANSLVLQNLDELKKIRQAGKTPSDFPDPSATNIRQAMDAALLNFDAHSLKRIVLFTDGNENEGSVIDVIPRLKKENIPVYTVVSEPSADRDVWIESILTRPEVRAGETFPLDVYVNSQIEGPAELNVRYDKKSLANRKLRLVRGLNQISFDVNIKDKTGAVPIEAEITGAGDPFLANNIFRSSVLVRDPSAVLYVESRLRSALYLQEALRAEGLNVTTLDPSAFPANVELLTRYDAILISDVAPAEMTDLQMHVLDEYVRDWGGGFVFVAGENTYGEKGYSKTAIEKILPVTFEVRKEKPLSMIVVLDKSESMTGLKMDLSKEATRAAVELLKDTDLFGVVAFDSKFYWAVPFQPVTDKAKILDAIDHINPKGETDIFPALNETYEPLAAAQTEMKHVILLSDGKTFPDDFQSLVRKMTAAKITVSTVAVGSTADRDLLANIANWGNGRTYYLVDPSRVPQIFVDETQLAKGTALREDPFVPLIKKNAQTFKGINFGNTPPLLGYVATRPKRNAEVLLESSKKDPILARWQYGLGKSVIFTSDVKNRWAVEWLRWKDYSKFWSQLLRQTMRSADPDFDFRVARDGSDAKITLNAFATDGQFRDRLQAKVKVVDPDGMAAESPLQQVGPGSYEARFRLGKKGSYFFSAIGRETEGLSRILAYSYPEEYHFYPANTELLKTLSRATGGKVQAAGIEDVLASDGQTTDVSTDIWPYLAGFALLLYLGDVWLRRVRIFERGVPA